MPSMDMPNVPPQNIPVMIAQANQATSSADRATRTIGICSPTPNNNYSLENVVVPIDEVNFYLQSFEHQNVRVSGVVTILQHPKHGVFRLVTEADRGTLFGEDSEPLDPAVALYAYLPEKGYLGKDSATALVDISGVKIKLVYFFHAIDGSLGNDGMERLCGKRGIYWKISSTLDAHGKSTVAFLEQRTSVTKSS